MFATIARFRGQVNVILAFVNFVNWFKEKSFYFRVPLHRRSIVLKFYQMRRIDPLYIIKGLFEVLEREREVHSSGNIDCLLSVEVIIT